MSNIRFYKDPVKVNVCLERAIARRAKRFCHVRGVSFSRTVQSLLAEMMAGPNVLSVRPRAWIRR